MDNLLLLSGQSAKPLTFDPPGELIIAFGLDDHAIHVGLGIAPDLPLEASLNGLPVGGTYVLEPEYHGVVAVGPEGGDQGRLLLIRLL